MTSTLQQRILETLRPKAAPEVRALGAEILRRHGAAVQAVLYYGSCLRRGDAREGLVDLYVLVDGYRSSNRGPLRALLNRLLPPNVFYLETDFGRGTVRSKYALLSMDDLRRGTSRRWFHSYLWGRFSQPAALVYCRSERVAGAVSAALAAAVVTFVTRVMPCLPAEFTVRELWQKGLELSYRAEIRTENPERQVRLFDAAPDHFGAVTRLALGATPYRAAAAPAAGGERYRADIPAALRRRSRRAWRARILQGKLLSALRLVKGSLTFEGGVDYILWKIRRHTGVAVAVGPRLRRHPLIAMGVLSWRLYRRGGIR